MDVLIILSLAIAGFAIAMAFFGDLKRAGETWLAIAAFVYLLIAGGVRSLEHGMLTGIPLSILLWVVRQLGYGTLSLMTVVSQVRAALVWVSLFLIPTQFAYLLFLLSRAKIKRQQKLR